METCAVILNPISGSGRGRPRAADLKAHLAAAGLEAELLPTTYAGHARELAVEASERHRLVVVVGGDGTVGDVAAGLAGGPNAMAVLPSGSGNDFAMGLGIPNLAAGLAAIRGGAVRVLDLGEFAGRPFINSCGLFLNGEVSRRAAGVARRWGRFRYPLATVPLLGRYREPRARWHFPEGSGEARELEGRWALAEVGNGPRCGGGFLLTPNADPGDGLLDFCLVRRLGLWDLLRTLPKGLRGSHLDHPRIHSPRAAWATLEIDRDTAAHWDGEPDRLPAGRHEFRLRPGAVRVIVPSEEGSS